MEPVNDSTEYEGPEANIAKESAALVGELNIEFDALAGALDGVANPDAVASAILGRQRIATKR